MQKEHNDAGRLPGIPNGKSVIKNSVFHFAFSTLIILASLHKPVFTFETWASIVLARNKKHTLSNDKIILVIVS